MSIDLNGEYVLLICEENPEVDILNILLDNDFLIFNSSQLVDDEPHKIRSARAVKKLFKQRL